VFGCEKKKKKKKRKPSQGGTEQTAEGSIKKEGGLGEEIHEFRFPRALDVGQVDQERKEKKAKEEVG